MFTSEVTQGSFHPYLTFIIIFGIVIYSRLIHFLWNNVPFTPLKEVEIGGMRRRKKSKKEKI